MITWFCIFKQQTRNRDTQNQIKNRMIFLSSSQFMVAVSVGVRAFDGPNNLMNSY